MIGKKIVIMVVITVGVGVLIGAVVGLVRRSEFLSKAVETQGVVVGHVSDKRDNPTFSDNRVIPSSERPGSRRTTTSSSPIIEFQTQEGKTIRFTSGLPSEKVAIKFGKLEDNGATKVPVLYMPDDPSRAEIKDFFAQTGWIILLIVMGVILTIAGVLVGLFFPGNISLTSSHQGFAGKAII